MALNPNMGYRPDMMAYYNAVLAAARKRDPSASLSDATGIATVTVNGKPIQLTSAMQQDYARTGITPDQMIDQKIGGGLMQMSPESRASVQQDQVGAMEAGLGQGNDADIRGDVTRLKAFQTTPMGQGVPSNASGPGGWRDNSWSDPALKNWVLGPDGRYAQKSPATPGSVLVGDRPSGLVPGDTGFNQPIYGRYGQRIPGFSGLVPGDTGSNQFPDWARELSPGGTPPDYGIPIMDRNDARVPPDTGEYAQSSPPATNPSRQSTAVMGTTQAQIMPGKGSWVTPAPTSQAQIDAYRASLMSGEGAYHPGTGAQWTQAEIDQQMRAYTENRKKYWDAPVYMENGVPIAERSPIQRPTGTQDTPRPTSGGVEAPSQWSSPYSSPTVSTSGGAYGDSAQTAPASKYLKPASSLQTYGGGGQYGAGPAAQTQPASLSATAPGASTATGDTRRSYFGDQPKQRSYSTQYNGSNSRSF